MNPMKKYVMDLVLTRITELRPGYVELRLARPDGKMPAMVPGQFFEVRIDDTPSKFLRRPISVNNVKDDELWLLVHAVGNGTQWIANRRLGDTLNVIGPLGNGFDMDAAGNRPLLVGGGVGTAPMLYLGQQFVRAGAKPIFLLGGRSASDLLQLEHFQALGEVLLTTEDGSAGETGFVTQHTVWKEARFTGICTCGPKPMMWAVARQAKAAGIGCQASLENMMACGLGACLCCVEKTVDGNLCVCKEGPVFDTSKLIIE